MSPDGTSIVFLRARYPVGEVWMMGANGEQPQRFVAGDAEELYWQVGWSPDGSRVVYGVSRRGSRAIESRNQNGTDPTVILSDLSLFQSWRGVLPFRWMANGHLLYTRREPPPNETGSNLWQIAIDASGRVSGVPQRVNETIGFNVRDVTTSADGRRVAFLRERSQADVYMAPLLANPPRLADRHRLTLDDRYDYTLGGGWMPDGSVLFESNRGASWDIFKQLPVAALAEALVTGADDETDAVSTPDGTWILYRRGNRLMRTPVKGGPAESVAEITDEVNVRCGIRSGARCVIGETHADAVRFSELDPLRGTRRELRQVARDTSGFVNWSLSTDGRRVAVVDFADRIRIAGLDDDSLRTISLEGWTAAEFVAWSADDAGLFVQPMSLKDRRLARTTLLYVDLQGRVQVLLDEENEWYIHPTASPDGRHLAFTTMRQESNAWMIER